MKEVHNNGGISFPALLQVAFIVLKLCGVISWNWLTVFTPLIITSIVFLVAVLIIAYEHKIL